MRSVDHHLTFDCHQPCVSNLTMIPIPLKLCLLVSES
jgi:hypothetical protein